MPSSSCDHQIGLDFGISPSPSDEDDSDWNCRMQPHWPSYGSIFLCRGFRLDTVRDVKQYYRDTGLDVPFPTLVCLTHEDDDLCPDAGLPDHLYRGTRLCDDSKVVVKAVHSRSRELDIIHYLSTPPMRGHPMNHTIPVLDIIRVPQDHFTFIVMEQWSAELVPPNNCVSQVLEGMKQLVEHIALMHGHCIAHLDISCRNILSDRDGRYAYIDFERSRRFDDSREQCMTDYRGTEIPPECEKGECTDPYKIDVWALAILLLRACKLTGHCIPELLEIIKPMLNENPDDRPTVQNVLKAFNTMLSSIGRTAR